MHDFVIFHSENKQKEFQVKLVTSYTNRLIIAEDDQNEIIEIIQWKVLSYFPNLFFQSNMAVKFINFINDVIFKNEMSFSETLEFVSVVEQWSLTYKKDKNRSLHYIFALPISDSPVYDFNDYLVSLLTHSNINYHYRCKLTLLQGRQGIHSKINEPSIGDDIELFANQIKVSTQQEETSGKMLNDQIMITDQSESSSVYQTVDETFITIRCKRKSYTKVFDVEDQLLWAVVKPIGFFIFIASSFSSQKFWYVFIAFVVASGITHKLLALQFFIILKFCQKELKAYHISPRSYTTASCITSLVLPSVPILIGYCFLIYHYSNSFDTYLFYAFIITFYCLRISEKLIFPDSKPLACL